MHALKIVPAGKRPLLAQGISTFRMTPSVLHGPCKKRIRQHQPSVNVFVPSSILDSPRMGKNKAKPPREARKLRSLLMPGVDSMKPASCTKARIPQQIKAAIGENTPARVFAVPGRRMPYRQYLSPMSYAQHQKGAAGESPADNALSRVFNGKAVTPTQQTKSQCKQSDGRQCAFFEPSSRSSTTRAGTKARALSFIIWRMLLALN